MIPPTDNNHTAEMVALLTDMFRTKAVISGILEAVGPSIQEVEAEFQGYLAGVILTSAVGAMLDQWGAVVGQPRNGLSDADYLTAILLEVLVLHSKGLSEDLLNIVEQVVTTFTYAEYQPASFEFYAYDITGSFSGLFIANALSRARSGGTYGVFQWTSWPLNQSFVFGSSVGTVATARGLDDSVGHGFTSLAANATVS